MTQAADPAPGLLAASRTRLYVSSQAAVPCAKSKPPSSSSRQSRRWDLRLLPLNSCQASFLPHFILLKISIFLYDCLKHEGGIHELSSAGYRLFQFVLILSPASGFLGPLSAFFKDEVVF